MYAYTSSFISHPTLPTNTHTFSFSPPFFFVHIYIPSIQSHYTAVFYFTTPTVSNIAINKAMSSRPASSFNRDVRKSWPLYFSPNLIHFSLTISTTICSFPFSFSLARSLSLRRLYYSSISQLTLTHGYCS